MNSLIKDYYPTFEMYQSLRDQLMDLVSDEELGYSLPGANPTLGALCRGIGEVEYSYIESFKSFKLDFSYRNEEPGLEQSVNRLSAWFKQLDEQLKAAIESLSEDDVKNRLVDRGGDFKLPSQIQLEVYKEALLIFYGKVSVYLKALNKPLPEQWQEWIG